MTRTNSCYGSCRMKNIVFVKNAVDNIFCGFKDVDEYRYNYVTKRQNWAEWHTTYFSITSTFEQKMWGCMYLGSNAFKRKYLDSIQHIATTMVSTCNSTTATLRSCSWSIVIVLLFVVCCSLLHFAKLLKRCEKPALKLHYCLAVGRHYLLSMY